MFFYFIFFLLLGSFINVESSCPNVSTVDNFNLTEYVRDRWYIQRQQVTNYLPIETNYCVSARYSISNKKVPFYQGTVLNVYNQANMDGVNGTNINKNNFTLCARIPDSNVSSKLLVAPCFLPNIFAGDYWVIDAGPSSNNYQYAIVSGGQPTIQLKDGCTTSTNGTNDSGFWFFTRQQNVNNTLINLMNTLAREKGFSLMLMNNVTQKGCIY